MHHITIFLIIPFKRILCTNRKNCNFDTARFKILHGTHMIGCLSWKLSSVIIVYSMNTTPTPKLNQCSVIGKEKNGENMGAPLAKHPAIAYSPVWRRVWQPVQASELIGIWNFTPLFLRGHVICEVIFKYKQHDIYVQIIFNLYPQGGLLLLGRPLCQKSVEVCSKHFKCCY